MAKEFGFTHYLPYRISAIRCLMATFYVHDGADSSDIVLRDQVSNLMFIMLPKVVATLQKIVHGAETQGQLLIAVLIVRLLLTL